MSIPPTADSQRERGSMLPRLAPGAPPRRVILESPYAGAVDRNIRYARRALRDALLHHGEAPIASHLLYTQEGVLDDGEPHERRLGMQAGFAWVEAAEATVVYQDLGISSGMRAGIARARSAGRPVEFRSIPDWEENGLASSRVVPAPASLQPLPLSVPPPRARGAGAPPAAPAKPAGMPRARGAR